MVITQIDELVQSQYKLGVLFPTRENAAAGTAAVVAVNSAVGVVGC